MPIIFCNRLASAYDDGGGGGGGDDDDGVGNGEYGACMSCPLTDWRYACMSPLLTFGQETFIFSKVIRTSCRSMEVVSHDGWHCKFS